MLQRRASAHEVSAFVCLLTPGTDVLSQPVRDHSAHAGKITSFIIRREPEVPSRGRPPAEQTHCAGADSELPLLLSLNSARYYRLRHRHGVRERRPSDQAQCLPVCVRYWSRPSNPSPGWWYPTLFHARSPNYLGDYRFECEATVGWFIMCLSAVEHFTRVLRLLKALDQNAFQSMTQTPCKDPPVSCHVDALFEDPPTWMERCESSQSSSINNRSCSQLGPELSRTLCELKATGQGRERNTRVLHASPAAACCWLG
ncbi:hypothetical protein RRG08_003543 [Elysia crispata]|uniref:Uncharacterized protein n=1 Tax=Elysia crispata TaxID=231223 RepID=A0AAE1CTB3_9GAST|nr:hypothetical protein RRG08_003543 [Elysia crispata]